MGLLDSLHDALVEVDAGLTKVKNELSRLENSVQGADLKEAVAAAEASSVTTAATTTIDELSAPVGSNSSPEVSGTIEDTTPVTEADGSGPDVNVTPATPVENVTPPTE